MPTLTSINYDTAKKSYKESTVLPLKSPNTPNSLIPVPLPSIVTQKKQYKKREPKNRSDFNIKNIIKKKRTRSPKKIYKAVLVLAISKLITIYYGAFISFILARKFYEINDTLLNT